jgi:HD-GYP domain-containing protein (c-di-GMP phosphodiesterase class II)
MGYPSGKKGQEISLAARILSVADVYEAITTDRIYRSAMMEEEAIAIINAGRGTQFDPDVVDALIRLIAKCSKYTSCKA